jgi:hypothetical protein
MTGAHKDIFVLYSPGLGGTHLANLLATDARYTTRATSRDYADHNEFDAHIGTQLTLANDNIPSTGILNNIYCGHFGTYVWKMLSIESMKKSVEPQLIIINIPGTNSLGFTRWTMFNPFVNNEYSQAEQKILYSPFVYQKLFGHSDYFTIDSQLIFQNSSNQLIDYVETEMNFLLDHNECKKMHEIWIDKIKKYVNNKVL